MAGLENQTFAGYEIISELGRGGMGAVYKARQPKLDRLVALKIMATELAGDPDFVARFKREANAAAALNHQNIVQVFSAGECEKTHFIAMEFVEGETLRHHIESQGRLDPREAVAITVLVAQALQYAWNKARIIHRDIKPENIFLSKAGEVKVGDLGLAKTVGGGSTSLTQTGMMMGSPHYISPEQARGLSDIDFRADIYSLGCTLYHMLTGRPPYEGSDPLVVINKHVNEPPPAIFKAWPTCPIPLALAVGKMLAKQRHERPASYEELIEQLREVREKLKPAVVPTPVSASEPTQVLTPTPKPAVTTPAPKPAVARTPTPAPAAKPELVIRNWKLVMGGVAGVVVLLLAGLFVWSPWSKPSTSTQDSNTPTIQQTAARPVDTTALEPGAIRLWDSPDKIPNKSGVRWENSAVVFSADYKNGLKWKSPLNRDATIRADIRMNHDASIRCIGLRHVSTPPSGKVKGDNYYRLELKADQVALMFIHANSATKLQGWPLPRAYGPDEWIRLELRAIGDELTTSVDGQVLGTIHDSSLPEPGGVLVHGSNGSFRNIVYVPLDKKAENAASQIQSAVTLADAAAWQNAINLLPLIDLQKDAVAGVWTIENGELVSNRDNYARIEMPYQPPDEYDYRIEFSAPGRNKTGPVQLLSKVGREFRWQCFMSNGKSCAFESVGGKTIHESPARAEMPLILQNDRRYVSLVEVRNGVVRGYLDGKLCVEWKTDYADMDIPSQWKLRAVGLLGVGSQIPTTFHRIEVREVTGKGTFTRAAPASASNTPTLQHSNTPAPWLSAFCAEVSALPAEQQVARVVTELKKLNRDFDATSVTRKIEDGQVTDFLMDARGVTNVSPVRALARLKRFACLIPLNITFKNKAEFCDLSPLKGLMLESITLNGTSVTDLSPLKAMPLTSLKGVGLIPNLEALRGFQLQSLALNENTPPIKDLSPLMGMPLENLSMNSCAVTDLSPLKGMPLKFLTMSKAPVRDLSPLKGMPLVRLDVAQTMVTDLSPLAGMPITDLSCTFVPQRDTALLRSIKTLKTINRLPADEFWKLVAAGKVPNFKGEVKDAPSSTTDDAFIREVAALPAEQQVARVVAKLKELNPGFDGQETHRIADGKVEELLISAGGVTDISPVRALAGLKKFLCNGTYQQVGSLSDLSPLRGLKLHYCFLAFTQVSDLSPLQGMPLVGVNCKGTRVRDLSPLKGAALTALDCDLTQVTDLSTLKGMPLTKLYCHFDPTRDANVLRFIKTLETINNLPVAELWKQVDAGKAPSVAASDAFIREVAALPAEQQVARVVAKLKELNPGFDGAESLKRHKIEDGIVSEIIFCSSGVTNIAPVRALAKLNGLSCAGPYPKGERSPLEDLSPLRGLPLKWLNCLHSRVFDLSPLRGMPLETLRFYSTPVEDLTPLRDMPLKILECFATRISDLAPLSTTRLLEELRADNNPAVRDLSPLRGLRLKAVCIGHSLVSDLSPLAGMPLKELAVGGTQVSDLSPLAGMPLERIICDPAVASRAENRKVLNSISTLQTINKLPAAEFWKKVEAGEVPKAK